MKKNFVLLLILLPFYGKAQLVINEIMPKNVSAVMDDAYNYSMWVEIYNVSEISCNLSNFYFTDDLSQPKKWRPSSKLIAPKAYCVLWFEREDRTGHASFKLEPDGGQLYLMSASSQVVDKVIYPKQHRNVSYGRAVDGRDDWVFFEDYSPGASNDNKATVSQRSSNPVFTTPGGFYSVALSIKFNTPATGDTIYYTMNGSEPTRNSTRYTNGSSISLTRTTPVRAKCFSAGRIPSEIVSTTYFIKERDFKLPVVSIVTTPANLSDNTIGIYVKGTNGITGNGMDSPANWNQDWDRPANIELYGTDNVAHLNQELDIRISGGWSRMNGLKSLVLNSKKKFSNNKLDYDIFKATKPNQKYKSILFRNSGNDFSYSMMRDAYMASLISGRMDIDYMAYEPAVCFINGTYYGIQNLRERSNKDLIYSNYGLKEEDIHIVEAFDMPTDAEYLKLVNYLTGMNLSVQANYEKACEVMDVDNFLDYMMAEMFFGNTDWPHNNMKAWKKIEDGKWRWIMHDTDFGYGLYDSNNYNHNTLTYVLDFNDSGITKENITRKIMKALLQNADFKNKLIDRYCIHLSSTFETQRADHILDSLASRISTEIVYHKSKWGSSRSFDSDLNIMRTFSSRRSTNMLGYISNKFLSSASTRTIEISSDNPKASYAFNSEKIVDPYIQLKSFNNRTVNIQATPVPGYSFKHWELLKTSAGETIIPYGSEWRYSDIGDLNDLQWKYGSYDDTSWKSGKTQLGYGNKGEVTTMSYGPNGQNRYTAAYFRKNISLKNLGNKNNFSLSIYVDDGAVVYVNGTEIGRVNMPSGVITYATFSTTYNNGVYGTFDVPKNLLKEGDNLIAVEVHQCDLVSSDLIFNVELSCESPDGASDVITEPVYTATLTSNIKLKAVYETLFEEDPDKDMRVVINELVATNSKDPDEYDEYDDYIELYNAGDKDVNIAGWYISDKPNNKQLCQIPDTDTTKTLIPAKDRIIIWADGQPEQGVLHVGFSLSKDGENLILSKYNYLGDLVTVDSVAFQALTTDFSYARVPDASDDWYIQPATFNRPNDTLPPVSIESVTKEMCRIYPTVVSEYFKVEQSRGESIKVIDLTGKNLLQKTILSDNERIDVNSLKPGVYLVLVRGEVFKIVKR